MDVAFTIPNNGEEFVLREYKHAGNRQPGTPYTLAEILGIIREEEPEVDLHVIDGQIEQKIRNEEEPDAENWSYRDTEKRLEEIDPDLVVGMISCFDIPTERKYIEYEEYPTLCIICPCTTNAQEADRIYDLEGVDYFTMTEVENTMLEAVREIRDEGEITRTPGIYRRDEDGELVQTGLPVWRDEDPPMPAFDLAQFDKYIHFQRHLGAKPYALLNTTKGCPFGCEFCTSSVSELKGLKPADQVLDELESLHERYGVTRFQFIDDEFAIRMPRAMEICQGMIDFDFDVRFEAINRIEFMDDEFIAKADEAGMYKITFGMETGDKKVQKEIKKELDLDHAADIFQKLSESNINSSAFMTVGLPGEDGDTLEKNKQLLRDLTPDVLSCGTVCFPAPSTPLYNRMKEEGKLLVEDWSKYKDPDEMLFEHDYYDSLEDIKATRDELQNWWNHYKIRHDISTNPRPRTFAKAGIDYLKMNDTLYGFVESSNTLTNVYHKVYGALEERSSSKGV